MPHGDDPINIKMSTLGLCGKHVECRVDVLKRPWISATGSSNPRYSTLQTAMPWELSAAAIARICGMP